MLRDVIVIHDSANGDPRINVRPDAFVCLRELSLPAVAVFALEAVAATAVMSLAARFGGAPLDVVSETHAIVQVGTRSDILEAAQLCYHLVAFETFPYRPQCGSQYSALDAAVDNVISHHDLLVDQSLGCVSSDHVLDRNARHIASQIERDCNFENSEDTGPGKSNEPEYRVFVSNLFYVNARRNELSTA